MMNQEIAEDIIKYVVSKATISLDNRATGFLTGKQINSLSKEVIEDYLEKVHLMSIPYILNHTYEREEKITSDDSVRMFQYIFDRSFEISYKLIMGQKAYTKFDSLETNDYYELDVPEYIQLKVNRIVPKTVLTHDSSYKYIEAKGYLNDVNQTWISPLLFGASCIALSFALEMDMNDDSEMQEYLAAF